MKDPQSMPKPDPKAEPVQKDLELAERIHFLANTIYGRLATTHPWLAPSPAASAFSGPEMWPPTPHMGAGVPPWTGPGPWTG